MVDSNQRVVSRKRGQYGAGLVVLSLQKKMVVFESAFQRNSHQAQKWIIFAKKPNETAEILSNFCF